MDSKTVVRKMSDEALARWLMNAIWAHYDAGGISHGRAFHAHLLESAMNILPIDFFKEYGINREDLRFTDIRDEIGRRKKARALKKIGPIRDFTLSGMPDACLISLLLTELERWHKAELAKIENGARESYYSRMDHDLLILALTALQSVQYAQAASRKKISYSANDLIKTAQERYAAMLDREPRPD